MNEKEVQKHISERIREIRTSKNISQVQLAKRSGIQNTTICAYEKNKRSIGLYNLSRIAKGLDTTIDELYYGGIDNAPIIKAMGDVGRRITNCIYELYKDGILQAVVKDGFDGTYEFRVPICKYPISKLLGALVQMDKRQATSEDEQEYLENLLDTASYEINRELNHYKHH